MTIVAAVISNYILRRIIGAKCALGRLWFLRKFNLSYYFSSNNDYFSSAEYMSSYSRSDLPRMIITLRLLPRSKFIYLYFGRCLFLFVSCSALSRRNDSTELRKNAFTVIRPVCGRWYFDSYLMLSILFWFPQRKPAHPSSLKSHHVSKPARDGWWSLRAKTLILVGRNTGPSHVTIQESSCMSECSIISAFWLVYQRNLCAT
jgi:hypothetical protein